MIWMWDALQVGLEPQPWHDISTSLRLNHNLIFLKFYYPSHLAQEQQQSKGKGVPICPSKAYQGLNYFLYI
jgi:hypothetical protein